MRSIKKPWPPRNVSREGEPACTMEEAERDLLASLPGAPDPTARARDKFDALDKDKLRRALRQEQRGICVYCERALPVGADKEPLNDGLPIEHWRSLSGHPELALHWENLYLSCPTRETCDGSKGHQRLSWADTDDHLHWPTEARYEDWIGFTSLGEAYVRSDAPLDEAMRRALAVAIDAHTHEGRRRASILNLNSPALIAARRAVIDSEKARLDRDFAGKTATAADRHARAARRLQDDPYQPFVSTRIAYLKKLLGKHR